jgi:signal peptidase I
VSDARRFGLSGTRLAVAAALVLAAVAIGGMLYLRTWPPFATVMSSSMSPTIKTGDVVLLAHLERPARVGDIVEVNVPDTARGRYGYPPVVIHRIVSISPQGQIQTKGDGRPSKDPFTVSRRLVTNRVVATIPAAGRIFAFLLSPLGLIWLVGGLVLLIGMPLFDRRRDQEEREHHTLEEVRLELQAMSAELRALALEQKAEGRKQEAETGEPEVEEPQPEPEPEPEPEGPRVVDELLVEDVPEWHPYVEWVLRVPDVEELPPAPVDPHDDPAPDRVVVRRRSGGLVGSVERYARSLSTRYR